MNKPLAYLQLMRLPNVFTAVADVAMGFLLTHDMQQFTPSPVSVGAFVLVVLASMLLYTSGMILNDVFDARVDLEERPDRPIPSGRVPLGFARFLGLKMMALGVAAAAAASYFVDDARPLFVALALAACVLAYDGFAKKTVLGPLVMGGCRALNALLGMSLAGFAWDAGNYAVAQGLGIYIVGVTWFARTEARESSRLALALATCVMAAGLTVLWAFPQWTERLNPPNNWLFFWIILGGLILWRCLRAILDPVPANVQLAVKQCIVSIIILDAAVAFAAQGPQGMIWALAILALLFPMTVLGRWVYST